MFHKSEKNAEFKPRLSNPLNDLTPISDGIFNLIMNTNIKLKNASCPQSITSKIYHIKKREL